MSSDLDIQEAEGRVNRVFSECQKISGGLTRRCVRQPSPHQELLLDLKMLSPGQSGTISGSDFQGDSLMATDRGNDVLAFRSFLDERISSAGAGLTLEEALTLWEYENSSEAEREETLTALLEGLEDLEAGRTRPARDVLAEIRRKYEIPESA
jgi:predicted transcriptional regulator